MVRVINYVDGLIFKGTMMQNFLRNMEIDYKENDAFHLSIHLHGVGFGYWFYKQDDTQKIINKLRNVANLIESDMQTRSAQQRNGADSRTTQAACPKCKDNPVDAMICGWCGRAL